MAHMQVVSFAYEHRDLATAIRDAQKEANSFLEEIAPENVISSQAQTLSTVMGVDTGTSHGSSHDVVYSHIITIMYRETANLE
jgi:hypothetical protein